MLSGSIFHSESLAGQGRREQARSWRAQQGPAKVFPAGRQGDLYMSGIHLISRLASVSRCAAVHEEFNNVSICQPSHSPSAPTKASMFTNICYSFHCIVVDSILPNTCQRSPCPGFTSTSPFSTIYCRLTKGCGERQKWRRPRRPGPARPARPTRLLCTGFSDTFARARSAPNYRNTFVPDVNQDLLKK